MNNKRFPAVVAGFSATCILGLSSLAAEETKATHEEDTEACIGVSKEFQFALLRWVTITSRGDLVACDGKARKAFVITPAGQVRKTIELPIAPSVVCMLDDATFCVGGKGQVLTVGLDGAISKTVTAKEAGLPETATPSGLAVSGDDLFVAYCRIPGERVSGAIYRLGTDLSGAKKISTGHRGCCGNLAIGAHDGKVYVAENSSHRVAVLDRDGKVIKRWGKRSRDKVEGFASCCNPMALMVDQNGTVYTSESGPNRIKRYSSDGKFLGLVGELGKPIKNAGKMAASCSNTAAAVNADGSRIYVLDEQNDLIRVLVLK